MLLILPSISLLMILKIRILFSIGSLLPQAQIQINSKNFKTLYILNSEHL